MLAVAIKTKKILPGEQTIFEVLDASLKDLKEKSVVALTSKVVSLCEGRAVPIKGTDKEALIRQEADYYLPSKLSQYGYNFTITGGSLTSASGIDESNANGYYVLWPADAQRTANSVRRYLKERFGLKQIGVIITDSTCMPLRWGTVGTVLAHSGFKALNNYVGQPDLFNRPFKVSRAGVAIGLAASAVLVMGEGAEQTPIVVLEDVPFVSFQKNDPTPQDIKDLFVSREEDLYGPFLNSVKWRRGGGGKK